jgi:hypothetical protein
LSKKFFVSIGTAVEASVGVRRLVRCGWWWNCSKKISMRINSDAGWRNVDKKIIKNSRKQIDDGKSAWKQVIPGGEVFYVTMLAHMFLLVKGIFRRK